MTRKSRWLLQTLILSVVLNCAFVILFFYFIIRDNPFHFSYRPLDEVIEEAPPIDITFVTKMKAQPFEQLASLLKEKRVVLAGWRVQDLGLSALVTFHDVDICRALNQKSLPKRRWIFQSATFELFPGLNEKDFQMIALFLERERWPFTTKGLLKLIGNKELKECDPDLLAFFCHTPEMILLQTLFARAPTPIQRGTLLKMVQEGGWDRLSNYYLGQEQEADFSAKKRQTVLLDYIEGGSKTAATLFLATDRVFAEHGLNDAQLGRFISLLSDKTEGVQRFLHRVIQSPRGDEVRAQARRCLLGSQDEEVAARFIPRAGSGELRPVFREQPPRSPAPSQHVIQPGESLWQIAKKYHVSIEELMAVNHLQSTVIRSGKTLKIPSR